MSATPSRVPSRPTTPLRRRSESRLSELLQGQHYALDATRLPLDAVLTNSLVELNDGLADLDQNLQHLQLMHESVTSFNESFSAFLYGIEMNAWCVEFPEAPTTESFRRNRDVPAVSVPQAAAMETEDVEMVPQDEPAYDEYNTQPQQPLAVPKSRLRPPSHKAAASAQSRIPSFTAGAAGNSRIPRNASTAKTKPATSAPSWR